MSCKTMSIDLANVPPVPIQIGVAGENSFRTITFDASKWGADYPDATYTVVYRRSDGYLYPVLVNASADAIVWSPTETDTAVSGNGQLEVRLLDGETIGKTIIMQTYVAPSLSGDESEPSTPAPDWVNDVAADADRAEAAVSHYPKIVDGVWFVWDAAQSEFVSTGISAQGEDGVSPTVQTEAITGGHRVTITDKAHPHGQSFDVMDGVDGTDGEDGTDGVSPTVQTEAITGGHRVTITDADGAHTFDVMDGEDGEGGGSAANAVLYTPQSLTDSQKAQARTNVGAGTYSKPSGGIPDSDIASAATWNAKGTYSKPSGGIPASDLASGVIPSVPQMATQTNMSDWTGGKTVDAATLKDGLEIALASMDNLESSKADKTEIPTKVSDLTNDSNFQTAAQVQSAIAAIPDELPSVTASDNGKVLGVVNGAWAVKSDEGGASVTVDDALSTTSENPVQNKVVKAALDGLTASDVGIEFMTAEDADDLWADADADIPDTEASGKVSRITEKLVLKESNNLSKSDSDWIVGYIVSNTKGNLVASSALSTSDYIPVNEGDVIRLYDLSSGTFSNREMRAIATYDASKTAVSNPDSTGWRQYSYTVVEGIKYVRVSAPNASQYMITKNYAPTVFEPWFEPYYVATREFVEDSLSDLTADQLKNGLAFALPQTIFRQTVGLSQTWYKKSMITPPSEFVYVRGGETGTTDFADKVTFQNASAKNSANGYLWYAYDPYFNLLKKYDAGTGYGASAKVIAENLQDCTVLVIGDSTVDAGNMTGSMLSYFTSKGKTLTLLGTLSENGNPLNRNEGRAGWNTADYMTNSTNNGYTNPFYNSSTGTFDFSYYMSQQGYSGVDFVVIQLGINDLYPSAPKNTTEPDYAAIWANMAAMISSIKAYNNSTKVIINLPTTPNSDPTKHGICEFLYRHWVVRYNEYALAKIKDYGTASVRASYCHLILDPATDIRDNVHPTAAGYEKMALELINQINVWQDGA